MPFQLKRIYGNKFHSWIHPDIHVTKKMEDFLKVLDSRLFLSCNWGKNNRTTSSVLTGYDCPPTTLCLNYLSIIYTTVKIVLYHMDLEYFALTDPNTGKC